MSAQVKLQLVGDERIIQANREDLSRESEYFKAMFSGNFDKGHSDTFELDFKPLGITFEVLEIVTKLQLQSHKVTKSTIEPLMLALDFLQLTQMMESLAGVICNGEVKTFLFPDNIMDLWLLSRTNAIGYRSIREALETHIKEMFLGEIIHERSFLQLDSESLIMILQWDDLVLTTEKKVFTAIKMWINHEYEERKEHYGKLLYCLRFDPLVDDAFLDTQVATFHDEQAVQEYVGQYKILLKDENHTFAEGPKISTKDRTGRIVKSSEIHIYAEEHPEEDDPLECVDEYYERDEDPFGLNDVDDYYERDEDPYGLELAYQF